MHSHAVAVLAAVAAVVVLGISQPASAGFITEASSVERAPPTTGGFTFDLTIDQSGLTMGYVSGVTDFAMYVALSPAHFASNTARNYAASFFAPPNAIVDYDLGSELGIQQLAFWQYPFSTTGSILDFDVYTSNDSTFADLESVVLVGSFTAVIDGSGLGAPGTGVQVFDLLDTSARFLRLDVQTVAGGGFGWSEVAFDVIPELPEPSTAALLGLGLAALAARRRSLGGAR